MIQDNPGRIYNVLVTDPLSQRGGRRATAAAMLVEAVRDGTCPAGPVQLVTSLPVIENFASVLRRHFGLTIAEASEKAWLLEQYALEGPMPDHPTVAVGSGYVPFETELDLRQAIQMLIYRNDAAKLFHEVQDNRYVLETALAGRTGILTTANLADFSRGPAKPLEREYLVLFPFAGRTLVVATPTFTVYWLRQGIVPDAAFVAAHAGDFVPRHCSRPTR